MDNSVCKKILSMMFLYIENKLKPDEKDFVENHFKQCPDCYTKYLEMKEVVNNLHFEYQKLMRDFDKIEQNQTFNIREYETFHNNISPYIDDELSYDDSIKFRKYLLKSKHARNELSDAYKLKNNIRQSVSMFKDNLNLNFSKKIVNQLKNENKYSFDSIYQKAAVLIGTMLFLLAAITIIMSFTYINHSFAKANASVISKDFEFPDDSEMVEFTFDYGQEALLVNK